MAQPQADARVERSDRSASLTNRQFDWDPQSASVTRDQRAAYDEMRERCPVARSESAGWSLFRHADIMQVLLDPDTFSSAVSTHVAIPNGMDPPEHTRYRHMIEWYFDPDRVALFEPACRDVAIELVGRALKHPTVEAMAELAEPFAVTVQCIFMGWPRAIQTRLLDWTRRNEAAIREQDRPAIAMLAAEFEALIAELLEERRRGGAGRPEDTTASLMQESVGGRLLDNEQIANILRNWTVGEIGTIAAAVGIVLRDLAFNPGRQSQLRATPVHIVSAVDEILRVNGPLVMNRRVTTRPVEMGGRAIEAGERISLMWIAGNRDPLTFDNPDEVRMDRDPALNLLYGAGIHACPGAPLARMELRVLVEEVLRLTSEVQPDPTRPAEIATYPSSGWTALPLRFS